MLRKLFKEGSHSRNYDAILIFYDFFSFTEQIQGSGQLAQ